MPVVFESPSDDFYIAFFEPDPDTRREKIEAWVRSVVPVIQAEVESELRSYLENIFEQAWTNEEWRRRVCKFAGMSGMRNDQRFIDDYQLVMEIKIHPRTFSRHQRTKIVGPVPHEVRAKTIDTALALVSQFDKEAAERTART